MAGIDLLSRVAGRLCNGLLRYEQAEKIMQR